MRLLKVFGLFFIAILVLNSCNNKLNILAPYKEAVSVYAVLNPQEKIQYIRVNKIFLGEGNAYDMAQVSDSINYKAGELTVSLERFVNGELSQPAKNDSKMKIVLKDTILITSSGAFNTTQRTYYTTDKLYTTGDYFLTILNNNTGNKFTSKTIIIDSARYESYYAQPLGGPYYPVTYDPVTDQNWYYVDYSIPATGTKPVNVIFRTTVNAREYSGLIRFHYLDSLSGGAIQPKSVEYKLSTLSSTNLTGNEQLRFDFDAADLVSAVYNGILKKGDPAGFYSRRAIKLEYLIYAGSQDLVDFLYISAPSTSVAQDKPVYTNIDGGYGIFGTRSRFSVVKQMHANFINYMAGKKPLCQLRFVNNSGVVPATCN